MNTIDAMRSAIEFIDTLDFAESDSEQITVMDNLRTAIAEMEKAEPVGWYDPDSGCVYEQQTEEYCEPLYRSIPLRDHYEDMLDMVTYRNDVIEECAEVCDETEPVFDGYGFQCAAAIRALKGKK